MMAKMFYHHYQILIIKIGANLDKMVLLLVQPTDLTKEIIHWLIIRALMTIIYHQYPVNLII